VDQDPELPVVGSFFHMGQGMERLLLDLSSIWNRVWELTAVGYFCPCGVGSEAPAAGSSFLVD
jgi:hypothetical protein